MSILAPDGPYVSQVWLKGILFSPWALAPGPGVQQASSQAHGRWLEVGQLRSFCDMHPQRRWVFRRKPDWLAPVSDLTGRHVLTSASLMAHYHASVLPRPEMWSLMRQVGSQGWAEERRMFVVPDGWFCGTV